MVASGWVSLLDYLAAHVLLCLVPAFFIAGALTALIPKEAVTKYLGPKAPKYISYPAAAAGGFVLAVFFYSKDCPDCLAIQKEVIPVLQGRFGSQLDLRQLEISDMRSTSGCSSPSCSPA